MSPVWTKDGIVVLCHDGTVSRMTGLSATPDRPSLKVIDLTFDELSKMDFSPGFGRFRNWTNFRYARRESSGVGLITFEEALQALPPEVPKLIEIKYDSTLGTGRGGEMTEKVLQILRAHDSIRTSVLYALDQDIVRQVKAIEPSLRMCAFDYKIPAAGQMALLDSTRADGLVLQLADVFSEDLSLTPLGQALSARHTAGSLRAGAVLYPYRGPGIPWIPTDREISAMRAQPWIWSCATDSMIEVAHQVWTSRLLLDTRFEGCEVDTRRIAFGYAKRNQYAHVYQENGVHVSVDPWDGYADRPISTGLERRVESLEDNMLHALRNWPFYSGGGLGVLSPLIGDFVAEVSYEVVRPTTQAFTLEMAVVNVDPGLHQPPLRGDGSRRLPSEADTFYDPHGAPPYVGVEHDEDDGYRINWNLGTEYESNRYGEPVGDGQTSGGRMRLERRGVLFSAYYRNDTDTPDWICVGSIRNTSMNDTVFLRCVAKRWRQRNVDGFDPIPANHVIFRHLRIHSLRAVAARGC